MNVFAYRNEVMFQHCDPAGIVFYPRYFEMINAVVETFFASALDWPFSRMHVIDRMGVPMGRIAAEFQAASRLGDTLDWTLGVTRLGRSTADLRIAGACEGEARLGVTGTLVYVDLDRMRAVRWPEARRRLLETYMEDAP